MNNLNKILLSSLIALSFSVQAKDEAKAPETAEVSAPATTASTSSTDIKTALEAYKKIQVDGDLEKSVDYVYPPIFTKIPKEMMLKSFESQKASGIKPQDTKLEQNPVLPVKKYAKGEYTTVAYTMETSIDMTPPKSDAARTAQMEEIKKNPEEFAQFKKLMLDMLKASLGPRAETKFQKDSFVIEVKKAGTYLAINEDNKGWKFIDLSPMLIGQIKDVLPKDIMENEKALFDELEKNAVDPMKAMMESMGSMKK